MRKSVIQVGIVGCIGAGMYLSFIPNAITIRYLIGKSSLIQASSGNYISFLFVFNPHSHGCDSMAELQSGKIEIDGINIRDIGLDALRSRLALVPQDSTLFLGTLRDNL
jgi:ABC-type iron transport system FetAB ATPase subunit